jgi:hypothetical protein
MEFLTDEMFCKAVAAQSCQYFDSHVVIRWFLDNEPWAYARELGAYAARNEGADPFPGCHSLIAKEIGRVPGVSEVGEIYSLNIRCKENKCKLWKK